MEVLTDDQLQSRIVARPKTLTDERLILYAGANLPSAAAQDAYAAALSAYPAMGPSFAKEQPDTDLVSHFEIAVRSEPGIFIEPHFWLRGWAFPLSEPARSAGWGRR
jgi:glycine hydroxymethyltransferase